MKQCVLRAVLFLLTTPLYSQWTQISFPSTEYLWKVRFANEQIGWVIGSYNVYHTTNGGNSWFIVDTNPGATDGLCVLNDSTAIYGNTSKGLRLTTNHGISWTTVDSEARTYSEIEFVTQDIGYASAFGNVIKKTTDGGTSWTNVVAQFPFGKYGLEGISFTSKSIGWALYYDGYIYKTTNGGSDWFLQDSLGHHSYRDIDFYGSQYGWIVGGIAGDQYLAYTTNGGITWNKIQSVGSSIREVDLVDNVNAWYTGMNNFPPYIAKINNNMAWIEQTVPATIIGFESIDMVNEYIGYAVGANGTVYKTTNGGITSVINSHSDIVPGQYALEQNYPNPFNPSTAIRFSLPETEEISLKIYSITGEMVEDLLHRTLAAGTHTISWNAKNYPSGVYFYTLRTNTFTETRKLVLMK